MPDEIDSNVGSDDDDDQNNTRHKTRTERVGLTHQTLDHIITTCTSSLTTLDIGGYTHLFTSSCITSLSQLHHIQHLGLSHTRVTGHQLLTLCTSFHTLMSLDISWCSFLRYRSGWSFLMQIMSQHTTTLDELHIDGCRASPNLMLLYVLYRCQSLHMLSMDGSSIDLIEPDTVTHDVDEDEIDMTPTNEPLQTILQLQQQNQTLKQILETVTTTTMDEKLTQEVDFKIEEELDEVKLMELTGMCSSQVCE
jgi:hypothetical protein